MRYVISQPLAWCNWSNLLKGEESVEVKFSETAVSYRTFMLSGSTCIICIMSIPCSSFTEEHTHGLDTKTLYGAFNVLAKYPNMSCLYMDVDADGVTVTAIRKDGDVERTLCKYAIKPVVSKSMMLTDAVEVPSSEDPLDPFKLAEVFKPSNKLQLSLVELREVLRNTKKSNLTFRAKNGALSVEVSDMLYSSQHFLSCLPAFTYVGVLSTTTLQIIQSALDLVATICGGQASSTKKRKAENDEIQIALQDDLPVHIFFQAEGFQLSCFFGTQEN